MWMGIAKLSSKKALQIYPIISVDGHIFSHILNRHQIISHFLIWWRQSLLRFLSATFSYKCSWILSTFSGQLFFFYEYLYALPTFCLSGSLFYFFKAFTFYLNVIWLLLQLASSSLQYLTWNSWGRCFQIQNLFSSWKGIRVQTPYLTSPARCGQPPIIKHINSSSVTSINIPIIGINKEYK